MRKPMLGHLDPEMHEILLDLVGMLREVFRAEGGLVRDIQIGIIGICLREPFTGQVSVDRGRYLLRR